MAEYRYTVLFEPAEEGGFVVTCPALPGLVTEGDTSAGCYAARHPALAQPGPQTRNTCLSDRASRLYRGRVRESSLSRGY